MERISMEELYSKTLEALSNRGVTIEGYRGAGFAPAEKILQQSYA